MISPDTIPLWFGIPAAIAAWTGLVVLIWRSSATDPSPEYSRLDVMDGLPHTD